MTERHLFSLPNFLIPFKRSHFSPVFTIVDSFKFKVVEWAPKNQLGIMPDVTRFQDSSFRALSDNDYEVTQFQNLSL